MNQSLGQRLVEHLETGGYLTVLVLGLREDPITGDVQPRVITPAPLPEILVQFPALQQVLRDAIENVIQVGKPPDDRKLTPGTKVEFSE